jgi:hypothetical protein
MKLVYSLVICFCFPLLAFGLRKSVHALIFGLDAPVTFWHRIGEAVGLILVSSVGILVPNIGVVFGFTGSITAVNLMYVYPALFFLLLWWRARQAGAGSPDAATRDEVDGDEKLFQPSIQAPLLLAGAESPSAPSSPVPLGAPGAAVPGAGGDISLLNAGIAALTLLFGILVCVMGTVANVINVVNPNAATNA